MVGLAYRSSNPELVACLYDVIVPTTTWILLRLNFLLCDLLIEEACTSWQKLKKRVGRENKEISPSSFVTFLESKKHS
nr:hypothetical protein CFP56_05015 [Quercus suber]